MENSCNLTAVWRPGAESGPDGAGSERRTPSGELRSSFDGKLIKSERTAGAPPAPVPGPSRRLRIGNVAASLQGREGASEPGGNPGKNRTPPPSSPLRPLRRFRDPGKTGGKEPGSRVGGAWRPLMRAAQPDACYSKSFRGPDPFFSADNVCQDQPSHPPSLAPSQRNAFFFFSHSGIRDREKRKTHPQVLR